MNYNKNNIKYKVLKKKMNFLQSMKNSAMTHKKKEEYQKQMDNLLEENPQIGTIIKVGYNEKNKAFYAYIPAFEGLKDGDFVTVHEITKTNLTKEDYDKYDTMGMDMTRLFNQTKKKKK